MTGSGRVVRENLARRLTDGSAQVKGGGLMLLLLEVPLSDGEIVLAEVSDRDQDVVPFGPDRDRFVRMAGSLGEGLGRARAFASQVLETMKESAEPPDRVAIEFGLTLSGKVGVVIAESAAEGHVTVTLEWSRNTLWGSNTRSWR